MTPSCPQGDNKCKASMPSGAGCVAKAPRMFANYRKFQIDVEWGHGYSTKPFATHLNSPTRNAVTQGGRVIRRAGNGAHADSNMVNYELGTSTITYRTKV